MFWDKKTRPVSQPLPASIISEEAPPAPPEVETPMSEPTSRVTSNPSASTSQHTFLGRTVVAQGQLSAHEDLVIEGQFEGTINLEDHCLTVGTEGHVKAEIRARQIVILGSVNGNLAAREKIEIRRTGHVVGDLLAATVAIEEGAYFKGSIDIAREDGAGAARDATVPNALKTSV
jgi:cytoskeletal protein CcmA (bactofilin family)